MSGKSGTGGMNSVRIIGGDWRRRLLRFPAPGCITPCNS